MHISLREWNRDSVFVESEFYVFGGAEIDVPVIGWFDPWADDEIDTAIGEFGDGHSRGGFLENSGVGGKGVFNDFFCFSEVIPVGDSDYQVDASFSVDGVVYNVAAGYVCVGDNCAEIVGGV